MLFFYAGAESAIGGWVAEHVRRMEGAGAGRQWTIAPMVFWAALALGRLLTPLVLRVLDEARVLVSALTVVLAASTAARSRHICAGCVPRRRRRGTRPRAGIPDHVRRTCHARSGRARPRAVGPAYAMASVGSAVLPWLVGFCSTRFGTLRAGLVVPIVSAIAMIALTGIRLTRERREPDRPSGW